MEWPAGDSFSETPARGSTLSRGLHILFLKVWTPPPETPPPGCPRPQPAAGAGLGERTPGGAGRTRAHTQAPLTAFFRMNSEVTLWISSRVQEGTSAPQAGFSLDMSSW